MKCIPMMFKQTVFNFRRCVRAFLVVFIVFISLQPLCFARRHAPAAPENISPLCEELCYGYSGESANYCLLTCESAENTYERKKVYGIMSPDYLLFSYINVVAGHLKRIERDLSSLNERLKRLEEPQGQVGVETADEQHGAETETTATSPAWVESVASDN
jgi:hypothetical protein